MADLSQVGESEVIFKKLSGEINNMMALLSEREKFVIKNRFGIDLVNKRTLKSIGDHFSVTRERIRQIESNALQKLKRNVFNYGVYDINNMALAFLEEVGGVVSEDVMLGKLLKKFTAKTANQILFILTLDKRFTREINTMHHFPYLRINSFDALVLNKIAVDIGDLLTKKGDVVSLGEVVKFVNSKKYFDDEINELFLSSLFGIYRDFKVVEKGVGLVLWKHIHPRTLKDKILFVLKEKEKAMHFVDIANTIIEHHFDSKSVNIQAVHNELIRNDEMVLIGRGIYALKEWGYEAGTVADVIERLLSGEKTMSEEEIIDEVLKRREVKHITIILNLKNKKQFIRVGRKMYKLNK